MMNIPNRRSWLRYKKRDRMMPGGIYGSVSFEPRILVGNAGFKGLPQAGLVEIGYSMLETHQRNGYCTEAVRALLDWAFQHRAVGTVIAHTLPGLTPSIRVMEKCGFVFAGKGPMEDGMPTIRYQLSR